ncbi:MAG: ATP-binding protein [Candidatus Cloacimonetes bacterium]|nr:ATP-binding protein [Candidatus Cloacimonadota bacterium]
MKEIVIISGKGGTGKTSITASFAMLAGSDAIIADCDVDAADMHLLLKPDWFMQDDFYSGVAAEIDPEKCIKCGKCEQVCRFEAINHETGQYEVSNLNCEGCGYCGHICPAGAISMVEQNVGKWYVSDIKTGAKMVHAGLKIGADNSGKLVAKVKREAKAIATLENKPYIIVDGSPGIGCPVVSSLSGADFVVFVTEPTVSGIHDLERVYQLVEKFRIPSGCIINKADLNEQVSAEIKLFLTNNGIQHLADLPYDESFTKAMTNGQTIVEYPDSPITGVLTICWTDLKLILEKQ